MQRKITAISAALMLVAIAGTAGAQENISAQKMQVKDHATDSTKRQIQVHSKDLGILYTEANNPGTDGAILHIYNSNFNYCALLPADPVLWKDNTKSWKYNNKLTKNQAQIANNKIQFKIRSGVPIDLTTTPQGFFNVQVQFGDAGTRFCMRCSGAVEVVKDDEKKFHGKKCAAVACDAETPNCVPNMSTTTTSTTTSTTLPNLPGIELQTLLSKTAGHYNYMATPGLPGAEAACDASGAPVPVHVCTETDLLAAEAAGDLDNLKDGLNQDVTSMWLIDNAVQGRFQCAQGTDGANPDTPPNWVYNTGHITNKGRMAPLNTATGDLGTPVNSTNCNTQSWVGCCAD